MPSSSLAGLRAAAQKRQNRATFIRRTTAGVASDGSRHATRRLGETFRDGDKVRQRTLPNLGTALFGRLPSQPFLRGPDRRAGIPDRADPSVARSRWSVSAGPPRPGRRPTLGVPGPGPLPNPRLYR